MATVEQAREAARKWLDREVRRAFYQAEGWQQATVAAGTPPQGATYSYVDIVPVGGTRAVTRTVVFNPNGLTLSTGDSVWVGKNARGKLVIKEVYA